MFITRNSWMLVAGFSTNVIGRVNGVIDGETSHLPYVVSVMMCEEPTADYAFYTCTVLCGGTLVGPSAVLTAAHCGFHSETHEPRPLDEMYVAYGMPEIKQLSLADASNLVRVAKVHTAPQYGANAAYHFDGDLALLELPGCIEVVEGKSEWIQIANPETEETKECTKVTLAGYGGQTNLHWTLDVNDGKQKVISDTVHSDLVCKEAFTQSLFAMNGIGPEDVQKLPPADLAKYRNGFDPSSMRCSGGDSAHALGPNDGGVGAVISHPVSGKPLLVGVGSYSTETWYGRAPDYWTRVARYYTWIRSALEAIATKCGDWKPEDSLPTSQRELAPYDGETGRCSGDKWQCPKSLECIERKQLCDGTPNCADNLDEEYPQCGPVASADVFKDIEVVISEYNEHSGGPALEQGEVEVDMHKTLAVFKGELKGIAMQERRPKLRHSRSVQRLPGMVVLPSVRRAPVVKHKAQAIKPDSKPTTSCEVVGSRLVLLRESFAGKRDINDIAALSRIKDACTGFTQCAWASDDPAAEALDMEDMCRHMSSLVTWQASQTAWRQNFSELTARECALTAGPVEAEKEWYENTPIEILAVIGLAALLILGA